MFLKIPSKGLEPWLRALFILCAHVHTIHKHGRTHACLLACPRAVPTPATKLYTPAWACGCRSLFTPNPSLLELGLIPHK